MRSVFLVLSLAAMTAIPMVPSAGASACSVSDSVRSCYFLCEGTDNTVSVAMSISEWWLQWASVQGNAYCGGSLAAYCAGHGDCQGSGYGPYGEGSCIGYASYGTLSGACAANVAGSSSVVSFQAVPGGIMTGEACVNGECQTVVPVCVVGDGIACGIGTTPEMLQAAYPQVLGLV